MRFIFIDYARERTAQKRDGGQPDVALVPVLLADVDARAAKLLTLNQALDRLTASNERLGRLVEYKFFDAMIYPGIA